MGSLPPTKNHSRLQADSTVSSSGGGSDSDARHHSSDAAAGPTYGAARRLKLVDSWSSLFARASRGPGPCARPWPARSPVG
jgi:hypothetical protein